MRTSASHLSSGIDSKTGQRKSRASVYVSDSDGASRTANKSRGSRTSVYPNSRASSKLAKPTSSGSDSEPSASHASGKSKLAVTNDSGINPLRAAKDGVPASHDMYLEDTNIFRVR